MKLVSKWAVKNPLTIEERKKIKEGLEMDLSYGELSSYVGRDKSTVMRESKRLGSYKDYDPEKAQEHFEKLQKEKREKISKTKRLCSNNK